MYLHLLAVNPDKDTYVQFYDILKRHPTARFLGQPHYYCMGYNFVVVAEENLEELFWSADILCKVIDL